MIVVLCMMKDHVDDSHTWHFTANILTKSLDAESAHATKRTSVSAWTVQHRPAGLRVYKQLNVHRLQPCFFMAHSRAA